MNLYRILRISGGRRRRGARLLTPFVGREEDLAVLARCSERALAGEGQFVLIVGEPGIGKSRLVEEFRGQLADRRHSWIEWSSSQLLQNTPLHPILGWGRVRFGGLEVAPERRLAELESLLADVQLDAGKLAPLLAPMVGIPVPPDRMPSLSPEEIRRGQLAAMVQWATAGARNQPLVLVLEDLQWFDPTSIDLVQALSDSGARAPILILATARPEFRPAALANSPDRRMKLLRVSWPTMRECLTSFMRGEHRQAHAEAEAFLREAEAEGRPTEAGVARRVLGFVSLLLGDLQAARKALERTLGDYVHERDRETLFRFGNDTRVSATNFLALTEWHLGELERARQLSEESNRRASEFGHAASIASALFFKTVLESRRGDIIATRLTVEALLALTEELNLKTYTDLGQVYANWVRGKQGDPDAGGAWAQAGSGVLSCSRQQERRAFVLRPAGRA